MIYNVIPYKQLPNLDELWDKLQSVLLGLPISH